MNSMLQTAVRRVGPILPDILLSAGLIGLDVVARLVPHTPNFTPVAASALFAAAVFRVPMLSFAVPVIAMTLSDFVLGFYDWRVMSVVYMAMALPAGLALWAGRSPSAIKLASLSLSSSIVFFLTTNFAVWAFEGIYSHDPAGLAACYVAALPFFKNTIIGDLFWTCALFGGYQLLRMRLATPGEDRAAGTAV
jgi:hypothetical protein